jgi:ABC-2 type transport system permease protein
MPEDAGRRLRADETMVPDRHGDARISRPGMGVRRFGRVNWLGLRTLAMREIQRFTNVWTQTLAAPVATAALFMVVFSLALGVGRTTADGAPFAHFLAPGIVMMTVIQNAFANTSSSILISKVQGNIVDTLMPPLSPGELLTGFTLGGVARGLLVALAVGLAIFPLLGLSVAHPLWALAFVLAGSALMALVGIMAAILAQKFDHLAALTNFVVTPLSFLSGTFYSIEVLPGPMQTAILFNPVFYLIDGMRYGVLGTADADPLVGLAVVAAVVAGLGTVTLRWLRTGYRLKS